MFKNLIYDKSFNDFVVKYCVCVCYVCVTYGNGCVVYGVCHAYM